MGFRILALTAWVFAACAHSKLVDLSTSTDAGKAILQKSSFDYIVVGGGIAGLTVATRLSEDPSKSVLVLEAGRSGVNDPLITIPGNSFKFIATDIDWLDSTVPQTHAANQTINISSGKVLGGGSAINGMVWTRGHKSEFDDIEKLGSKGWNWNTFYSHMKKAETLTVPPPDLVQDYGYTINPQSIGSSGPVTVSFPNINFPQFELLINASVELGHKFNKGAYSGDNAGVYYTLTSQNNAVRDTSEFAYLDPVLSRPNLVVFDHALVSKVNTTSTSSSLASASGVQVNFPDSSTQFAKTSKKGEVILSAGFLRTPQLLELSGIGDKKRLQTVSVKSVVDLPGVGVGYEDHTLSILTYKLKPGYLSFDALSYNTTLAAEQQALYDEERQGWLTFSNAVLNFAPADKILNAEELAEAKQILSVKPPSISQEQFEIIRNGVFSGVPQAEFQLFNSFSAGNNKENNTSYISISVVHLHPLSRGSIHINSSSINDHPIADANAFESDWDRWFLAKVAAYARKLAQTKAYQTILAEEVYPGPDVSTQTQWEDFVSKNLYLNYHGTGTANLLPRVKGGVVDPQLKVYGTSNIRVVDASILPILPSAHIQPTTYAIAERAAEIIRGH